MDALAKQTVASSSVSLENIDIEREQREAAGRPVGNTPIPEETPKEVKTEQVEKQPEAKQPEEKKEVVDDIDLAFDAAKLGLDIPTKKEEVKTEKAATQKIETQPEPRVLDDIEPELQPYFKQMSNEAFKRLKPIYLEKKKLADELTQAKSKQGTLPDSYYEHEMAYVLTPEFTQQSARVDAANLVLQHWKQQLAAVRNGADEYYKLEVDEKGQFRLSAPVKVDRNTLTELEDIRAWAHEQYSGYNNELQSFVRTHQTRSADVKNWLNEFESRAFPLLQQKKEVQAMVDDTIKKVLHPSLQRSPLAKYLGMSILIMTEQNKLIQSLQQGKTANTPAKQQQPSAAEIAGGGSVKPAKPANEDIDELFEKAKRGEI